MARSNYGAVDASADASRVNAQGLVCGNYVCFRLIARTAGVQGAATTVDRIPFLQPFRVSHVSFNGLGLTSDVRARVLKNNLTTQIIADATDLDGAANGVKRVTTGSPSGGQR